MDDGSHLNIHEVHADEVFPGEFFHLASRNFPKWSYFYSHGEVVDRYIIILYYKR